MMLRLNSSIQCFANSSQNSPQVPKTLPKSYENLLKIFEKKVLHKILMTSRRHV